MRTIMDVKHRRSRYFQSHPLHGAFALIASLVLLSGVIALMIAWSGR